MGRVILISHWRQNNVHAFDMLLVLGLQVNFLVVFTVRIAATASASTDFLANRVQTEATVARISVLGGHGVRPGLAREGVHVLSDLHRFLVLKDAS